MLSAVFLTNVAKSQVQFTRNWSNLKATLSILAEFKYSDSNRRQAARLLANILLSARWGSVIARTLDSQHFSISIKSLLTRDITLCAKHLQWPK